MRRLWAIVFLCFGSAAMAGSYDAFSRGIDATNRGDSDTAITAFTVAISAGDLAPSYLPSAYLGRARALLVRNRCAPALSDLNEAIRLRPAFVDAYSLRAGANHCLKRDSAALADADTAIHLKPAAGYFFVRSRIYWDLGRFNEARADAERAAASDPANGYFARWAMTTAERAPNHSLMAARVD